MVNCNNKDKDYYDSTRKQNKSFQDDYLLMRLAYLLSFWLLSGNNDEASFISFLFWTVRFCGHLSKTESPS